MTHILAKVTLETTPWTDDSIVNNFAFVWPSGDSVVPLFDAIDGFYRVIPDGGTAPVGQYLSSQISRAVDACRIQLYDITGRLGIDPATGKLWKHGSAFAEEFFTLPAAGTPAQLPSQVASVLTLRGRGAVTELAEGPGGIRPRARKSGRLYIGSLGVNAGEPGTATPNDYARPDGTFVNNVLAAGESLQDDVANAGGIWCIWSRANAALYGVTSVEMDNSFDVIRSRKQDPTSRTARVFAPVPDLALGA